MSVEHATFVIERDYPVPPSRVFEGFSDPELKQRWFGGPDWEWEMDFRVGGSERMRGAMESGSPVTLDALYYDIVPDERIVYAYDMHIDGRRISVSLTTVELAPVGDGTRLKLTEQGAFLDGLDKAPTRQGGTESLMDALGEVVRS